jgi:transposase-like protein
MAKQEIRRYTAEFKEAAVALSDRVGTIRAAKHLGLPNATLATWRTALKEKSQKQKEKDQKTNNDTESKDEEIRRLRKENEELKQVNYILKRAAAFFSQDHLK